MLTTLIFLLPPGRLKNRLLCRLGHDIHPLAHVGICLVRGVRRFELAEGVKIGHGNVFRGLLLVRIGLGGLIHQFNWISGDSGANKDLTELPNARSLIMARNSHIYSRHYIDCGGGIEMGEDTYITGVRSTFMSHGYEPTSGLIVLSPTRLEAKSMIALCSTILHGTVVGAGTFIAAGAVTKPNQQLEPHSLYGGSPAKRISDYEINEITYDINRYIPK
ncbi:acyltransferase [Smaragdicoccus niigatensis]|uniref:acyltransferase n=1 Tax=Smaragdicoccus niigatensis TaxID=359359 RepID=UPI00036A3623|nr:hypothetical protein [Smaragdicoccus niigatensis]